MSVLWKKKKKRKIYGAMGRSTLSLVPRVMAKRTLSLFILGDYYCPNLFKCLSLSINLERQLDGNLKIGIVT